MALLFNSSGTPQSMKDKKLYEDDSKFTDDDLQDVLDGLLKLRVSSSTSCSNKKSRITSTRTRPLFKKSHTNDASANRHNTKYQEEPRFIANRTNSRSPSLDCGVGGLNLLFEAAKKVEGRSNFVMDVSDMKRNGCFKEIADETTYNKETGIMKKKSQNGISPPDGHGHTLQQLQVNDFADERRISREWSNRNIEEMDQMYDDKSKLAQQLESVQSQTHLNKSSGIKNICSEFSDSNQQLHCVTTEHEAKMDKIRENHKKFVCEVRNEQNQMLKRQLAIMEEKIAKQRQMEEEMKAKAKRQTRQIEQEEMMKAQAKAKQIEQEAMMKAKAQTRQVEEVKQEAKEERKEAKPVSSAPREWYQSEERLCATYKHYQNMYKECEQIVHQMETN
eukprot:290097_1